MTTTTIPTAITEFATQVRGALADLPPEEVEELTDGLEADLAEAYAEDLARELPDPEDYAGELRAAAGLPAPSPAAASGRSTPSLQDRWRSARATWADLLDAVRGTPAGARSLEVLAALRPIWWFARAWAATYSVLLVVGGSILLLPRGPVEVVVLVAAVLGSVALGLASLPAWGRVLVVLGNLLAVIVLLLAAGDRVAAPVDAVAMDVDPGYGYAQDLTGLYLDGQQVSNVHAYDAAGQPLTQVQLFDQDGRPLTTSVPGGSGCFDPDCLEIGLWAPAELVTGEEVLNVYPLSMVLAVWGADGVLQPKEGAVPAERDRPFIQVPAVQPVAEENQ